MCLHLTQDPIADDIFDLKITGIVSLNELQISEVETREICTRNNQNLKDKFRSFCQDSDRGSTQSSGPSVTEQLGCASVSVPKDEQTFF